MNKTETFLILKYGSMRNAYFALFDGVTEFSIDEMRVIAEYGGLDARVIPKITRHTSRIK